VDCGPTLGRRHPADAMPGHSKQKQLSELDRQWMRDCFHLVDMKDGDDHGYIDIDQMALAMRALGLKPDRKDKIQLAMEIANLPKEGAGKRRSIVAETDVINLEVWMQLMTPRMLKLVHKEDGTLLRKKLMEVFAVLDKDGSGYIENDEFRSYMKKMGQQMTEAEINDMVEEVDINQDGKVGPEEFMAMMTKGDSHGKKKKKEKKVDYGIRNKSRRASYGVGMSS